MEDWKIKISALWLINSVSGVAFIVLEYIKGVLPTGSGFLDLLSIMLLVGLIMVFLSLTLNDQADRWANIIMGAVYTVGAVYTLLMNLENPVISIHPAAGIVFSALTIWYAWKSK